MKNSSELDQSLRFLLTIVLLAIILCGVIILRDPPPNSKVTPTPTVTPIEIRATVPTPRALVAPCESIAAPYAGRKSPYDQQDAQIILEGRQIYVEKCAVCHGVEGRGDGIGAIVLEIKPANFTDADFMRRMPVDCHFAIINEGVPGKSMPAWKQLGEDAIWKVLHYERGFTTLP